MAVRALVLAATATVPLIIGHSFQLGVTIVNAAPVSAVTLLLGLDYGRHYGAPAEAAAARRPGAPGGRRAARPRGGRSQAGLGSG